jgi:CheY-like chemotaxis protein/two-component sensor histidine kinase
MVDDLLDVSRVTRGLVQLDHQPVDMRTILAAALEQAEPALKARGHALAVDTANARAVVRGDRHRLVQVVSNLLNNAAKYTPVNGRITVSLGVDETEVTVRVSDNGIGMDERLVPQVFDLFTQGERTPDRSQGGLGIGLALVRSIVQMHGGRVFAHSPGVRQGSTFSVVLPREATAVPPAVEEGLPPRAAAPGWLLVVDDNRDAANTLADALRMLGHHVVVAGSGREALEVVSVRARWDALILDIGLPDMTGHELARRLRAKAGGAAMRIVALTGYGQEQDVALSRAAGFDCHLVKPADVAVIQRTLARMVAPAESCAQHAE